MSSSLQLQHCWEKDIDPKRAICFAKAISALSDLFAQANSQTEDDYGNKLELFKLIPDTPTINKLHQFISQCRTYWPQPPGLLRWYTYLARTAPAIWGWTCDLSSYFLIPHNTQKETHSMADQQSWRACNSSSLSEDSSFDVNNSILLP